MTSSAGLVDNGSSSRGDRLAGFGVVDAQEGMRRGKEWRARTRSDAD